MAVQQLFLAEPTSRTNAKPPHGRAKAVGPIGPSADQVVGRPPIGANRPQLPSGGLVWASSCPKVVALLVLTGFASVLGLHLVELSLILCSDIFCDFLLGQSVLATCIIAQKHILHILKGKVWFSDLFR